MIDCNVRARLRPRSWCFRPLSLAAAQTPADSTRARTSSSISATAPAAATTSMPACSPATWAGTFPATRSRAAEHGRRGQPAARQLALSVAPKDGTAFAHHRPRHRVRSAARPQGAQFDGRKFNWIGSANDEVSVCVAWHTPGITKFDDLLTKELIVGGTGASADTDQFPKVINARARHQVEDRDAAIPAATTSTSRWSAARSRAAAAGRGRASSRPTHPGSTRRRSTSWSSSRCTSIPTCRTCR